MSDDAKLKAASELVDSAVELLQEHPTFILACLGSVLSRGIKAYSENPHKPQFVMLEDGKPWPTSMTHDVCCCALAFLTQELERRRLKGIK